MINPGTICNTKNIKNKYNSISNINKKILLNILDLNIPI